ncbi:hypothetical protein [Pseudomonas paeninsulae]|uniref:hypothetical protein n=1 Tax=Pseudomonas paeninsulae TaxID=3110772 RepID=UPI002D786E7E|nr:hypothetical protein [Pseudomonas sp. IT1137]
MSPSQTRLLFKSGAIFNVLAGLPFLLAPGPMTALMGFELNPVALMFSQIVFGMIVAFGWAYWMIARDPVRYRPFILLGLALKIMVAAVVYGHWLAGNISWQLPTLAFGDIVFALLFWEYYQRTA